MNAKVTEHGLSILLVAMLLSACAAAEPALLDGQVVALGARTTALGLQSALAGVPGTHLLTDGKLVLALWPQSGLWGGACINCGIADPIGQFRYIAGGQGMAMTGKTAADLAAYLQRNGWTALPSAMSAMAQPYAAFFANISNTITGFLVIPAGVIPDLPEERPIG